MRAGAAPLLHLARVTATAGTALRLYRALPPVDSAI